LNVRLFKDTWSVAFQHYFAEQKGGQNRRHTRTGGFHFDERFVVKQQKGEAPH
jgi:hypothetical protein